jgi:hypothetical protein
MPGVENIPNEAPDNWGIHDGRGIVGYSSF